MGCAGQWQDEPEGVGRAASLSLLDALDYRLDQGGSVQHCAGVQKYNGGRIPQAGPCLPFRHRRWRRISSTPALLAYTLKLEQQIAPSTTLTIGYNGSHSYHQILSGDLEREPAFTTLANGAIFYPTTTKPNPALANSTSWYSTGSGNYNSLVVDLRHDLAHGFAAARELYVFEESGQWVGVEYVGLGEYSGVYGGSVTAVAGPWAGGYGCAECCGVQWVV